MMSKYRIPIRPDRDFDGPGTYHPFSPAMSLVFRKHYKVIPSPLTRSMEVRVAYTGVGTMAATMKQCLFELISF